MTRTPPRSARECHVFRRINRFLIATLRDLRQRHRRPERLHRGLHRRRRGKHRERLLAEASFTPCSVTAPRKGNPQASHGEESRAATPPREDARRAHPRRTPGGRVSEEGRQAGASRRRDPSCTTIWRNGPFAPCPSREGAKTREQNATGTEVRFSRPFRDYRNSVPAFEAIAPFAAARFR